ncbi:MAG: tRNA 2-selenouridine(34) synthase MnmH [Actinobacteria bacterium]|nr:tRNA 2-selenouridine(34) synthase MnmH [Actinomycetota bacterium]
MRVEPLVAPSISAREAVDGSYALVDVRSPREFAEGHVPGALNLPLLSDEQRAAVGVAYRERGAQTARMIAVDLISGGLPGYLRTLRVLAGRGRRPAVMCWRGGERSRNAVLLLALVGVQAVQVEGGYKAYRRMVLDDLEAWRPDRPVFTLYGHTGSGKTALLRALVDVEGSTMKPWVVDLEGLALHRGSLLGGLNQPGVRTQKDFDALLLEALGRPKGDYIVVEGEGGRIGRLFLPRSVGELVRGGIPVLVASPLEKRAERIMEEYSPGTWDGSDVSRFRKSLGSIGARLPSAITATLREAFDDGRFYDVVRGLLESYYDPLYQRSSISGKDFALVFDVGENVADDASCLARLLEPLTGRRDTH